MKRNITFSIIGLLLGVWFGFMGANASFRRDASAMARTASGGAASQMPKAASVNSSSSGQSAEEQSQQMMAQTRAVMERARNNPTDFDAQLQAADQFLQIHQPDGALEFLLKANQIKPDHPDVLANLSEAYFFAQKFDDAISWARRALKQRQDYPLAKFYLMASLIEKNQNLEEAERLLAELETVKPGDQVLAQVREHLQTAKQKGQSKTVLSHGPENKPK
jgi:tetratricopeptide (TPR) repeat protein